MQLNYGVKCDHCEWECKVAPIKYAYRKCPNCRQHLGIRLKGICIFLLICLLSLILLPIDWLVGKIKASKNLSLIEVKVTDGKIKKIQVTEILK